MEDSIISAVSSVGFPIVVAFYLLVRIQVSLDRFSDKMNELIIELRKERLA